MAVHNDMVVEDVYHRVDPKDSHQPMDAITQVHSGGCQARHLWRTVDVPPCLSPTCYRRTPARRSAAEGDRMKSPRSNNPTAKVGAAADV